MAARRKYARTIEEVKAAFKPETWKKLTTGDGMWAGFVMRNNDYNNKLLVDSYNAGVKAFGTSFADGSESKEEKVTTIRLSTTLTKWLDAQVLNDYIDETILETIKKNLKLETASKLKQLKELIILSDLTDNNKKVVTELSKSYGVN